MRGNQKDSTKIILCLKLYKSELSDLDIEKMWWNFGKDGR